MLVHVSKWLYNVPSLKCFVLVFMVLSLCQEGTNIQLLFLCVYKRNKQSMLMTNLLFPLLLSIFFFFFFRIFEEHSY